MYVLTEDPSVNVYYKGDNENHFCRTPFLRIDFATTYKEISFSNNKSHLILVPENKNNITIIPFLPNKNEFKKRKTLSYYLLPEENAILILYQEEDQPKKVEKILLESFVTVWTSE